MLTLLYTWNQLPILQSTVLHLYVCVSTWKANTGDRFFRLAWWSVFIDFHQVYFVHLNFLTLISSICLMRFILKYYDKTLASVKPILFFFLSFYLSLRKFRLSLFHFPSIKLNYWSTPNWDTFQTNWKKWEFPTQRNNGTLRRWQH